MCTWRTHTWLMREFTARYNYAVVADYLVGAIDGFAPYTQDMIWRRLAKHMRAEARMYVIGMQPIPDFADSPGDLVVDVTRIRDACILLAGHRCYRYGRWP
jgi:hypothetical protein